MKEILKDRSFKLSIILTIIFFGTGIAFLFFGLVDYSWILFILLPIVLGISIGAMPNKKYLIWGSVITASIILVVMVIPGLSGLLCIVMTLPIVVPLIFIGYIISHLMKRYKVIKSTDKFSVLLLPLLPFIIFAPTEHFLKKDKIQIVEVRTEQIYSYTTEQVFDAIKSVDTLVAEKPYLMQFDLPIPIKCILDKEEIGGIRTCYFRSGRLSNNDFGAGTIVEKVTAIERGKVLKIRG